MGGFSQQKQQQSQVSSSGAQASVWDQQIPFLQQLYGQAAGLAQQPNQAAAPAMGAWQGALSGQINPAVADVISNASREMGLSFQRDTLPGIRSGAIGAGALGGSRQGIAEGLAAGELARAQAQMTGQLTAQAQDRANANQIGALSMSGMMGNLPWQGVQNFAQAIGGPTVLNNAWSNSAGSGSGRGQSMSIGSK